MERKPKKNPRGNRRSHEKLYQVRRQRIVQEGTTISSIDQEPRELPDKGRNCMSHGKFYLLLLLQNESNSESKTHN